MIEERQLIFQRVVAVAAVSLLAAVPTLAQSELDLVEPIVDYKLYVSERAGQLVEGVSDFVAAIKGGDLAQAKALYPAVRVPYEEIEPIAELFSDLDVAIDSRADDYELAEQDPAFPGFHRLEYGLWEENSTEGLGPVADQLLANVTELQSRIDGLTLPPEKVVGGAAVLMEEVALTKISGEENRYSRTDLWDFNANSEGAYTIVNLVRPLIAESDPEFLAEVDANFDTVFTTLAKYEDGDGYMSYLELSDADRNALSAAINTLAEDLSTLRGKLGLG